MNLYLDIAGENKSISAENLLRQALKADYGIDMPKIIRDEFGKPRFCDDIGIYFSISHSGEYVLCAVDESPVGADIQIIRPETEKLIRRICSEIELEKADFFTLWCLKESFIKLIGRRDRPYKEIEFLQDGEIYRGPCGSVGKTVSGPEGYRIAVCGFSDENTLCINLHSEI